MQFENFWILQNWFHVKSEWQKNPKNSTLCILLKGDLGILRPILTILDYNFHAMSYYFQVEPFWAPFEPFLNPFWAPFKPFLAPFAPLLNLLEPISSPLELHVKFSFAHFDQF